MTRLAFQSLLLLALGALLLHCDGTLPDMLKGIIPSWQGDVLVPLGHLGVSVVTLAIVVLGFGCILRGISLMGFARAVARLSSRILLFGLALMIVPVVLEGGMSQVAVWASQADAYCTPISIGFCVVAFLTIMNILQLFLGIFIGRRAAGHAVGGLVTSTIVGLYMWLLYRPIRSLIMTFRRQY